MISAWIVPNAQEEYVKDTYRIIWKSWIQFSAFLKTPQEEVYSEMPCVWILLYGAKCYK